MKGEKKKVFPGTTIHKEKPFVHVLASKLRFERCDQCLEKKDLLKCTGCHYVHYCSRICQKDAWDIHKKECKNIKRVSPKVVPDAARILGRIIIKLQNGGDLEKGYYTKTNFRKFKDLMSHYSDIKEDAKRMEHFESLQGVLTEYLRGVQMPNSADLLGMYGRLVVNGFNILDPEMTSIGTGIYLGATILDHSCKPNAVAVFEGTTISIRTLELLPCLDWDTIFISYVDLLNTAKDRQASLQANYYFLCQCSVCLDENYLNSMHSAICPNQDCNEAVPLINIDEELIRCPKCKEKLTTEFKIKYQEAVDFSKTQMSEMENMIYLDLCKMCLTRQEGILHPLNILHVKMLDLTFEACIQVGNWDYAEEISKRLLPGYRKYNGENHPLLGILLLKIAKILLYKDKPDQAAKYLKQASDILAITHGKNHTLFKENVIPLMFEASQRISS